jgi:hypothetical protein
MASLSKEAKPLTRVKYRVESLREVTMQIRCFRCNWSYAIKKEEIAFALEALEESDGTHYDARCPRCRRNTPISLEQLRRVAPRDVIVEQGKEETEEEAEESSET